MLPPTSLMTHEGLLYFDSTVYLGKEFPTGRLVLASGGSLFKSHGGMWLPQRLGEQSLFFLSENSWHCLCGSGAIEPKFCGCQCVDGMPAMSTQ